MNHSLYFNSIVRALETTIMVSGILFCFSCKKENDTKYAEENAFISGHSPIPSSSVQPQPNQSPKTDFPTPEVQKDDCVAPMVNRVQCQIYYENGTSTVVFQRDSIEVVRKEIEEENLKNKDPKYYRKTVFCAKVCGTVLHF